MNVDMTAGEDTNESAAAASTDPIDKRKQIMAKLK
jgi:hypothetical protein